MKKVGLMQVAFHITEDWCHTCGQRREGTVDVWYPENAEAVLTLGAEAPKKGTRYLRICSDCMGGLGDVLRTIVSLPAIAEEAGVESRH